MAEGGPDERWGEEVFLYKAKDDETLEVRRLKAFLSGESGCE